MTPLHKILHIDDDAIMRTMVKKSLERSQKNFEIISCGTPSEFIAHIPSFLPDLLMIDVHMPLMKGPDLLLKIRESYPHIPALFMTGDETPSFANREKMDPMIGVLQKPFSPLTLGEDILHLWNHYAA